MSADGVVIFVPLQEEVAYIYEALMEAHEADGGTLVDFHQPFDKTLPEFNFWLILEARYRIKVSIQVIGDMGNLRTSTSIVPKLMKTHPNTAYLVGLAGSLSPEHFGLGDVAISHRAKAYYPDKIKALDHTREQVVTPDESADDGKIAVDPSKRSQSDSFFRYRRDVTGIEFGDGLISDYLEHIRRNDPPKLLPVEASEFKKLDPNQANPAPSVKSATIFGSEMVIDCQEYIDFLKRKNLDTKRDYSALRAEGDVEKTIEHRKRNPWFDSELDIVDMESFGFFKMIEALQKTQLHIEHAITVRGISDLASKKQQLDEDTLQVEGDELEPDRENSVRKIAVKNAARTCIDMIKWQNSNTIR